MTRAATHLVPRVLVCLALASTSACVVGEDGLARQALDDGDPGTSGDLPVKDPPPPPPPPFEWPGKELGKAMAEAGYEPGLSGSFSLGKAIAICAAYANNVVNRFQDGDAFQPAYAACMTGKPVDLGLNNYQTLEMRRAGFSPTSPKSWPYEHRHEVCQVHRNEVFWRLAPQAGSQYASQWASKAFNWCTSFGALGFSIDDDTTPPPSRWDYASWEFTWWKKHAAP